MTDRLTAPERSRNMRQIRGRHTKPELSVRKLVHSLGYRYRLHRAELPGSPDLVFKSRRKVIFVHGCFWHQHEKCIDGHIPKSNQEFWKAKLARNVARDKKVVQLIESLGWSALIIWACELRNTSALTRKIADFLTTIQ